MDTIFTHRPIAGVSVGAVNVGTQLFVAFAVVNSGDSRNGNYWEGQEDTFSRVTARAIINGRITGAQASGNGNGMSMVLETEMTARQFIAGFRQTFKTDPEENDDFLMNVMEMGLTPESQVEVRFRPTAEELVERLRTLTEEVVANASASV